MIARRTNTQSGFTLIELLIAMVIGLVLIGGVSTVFMGIKRSSELNTTLSMLQENGRFLIDRIAREARLAGYQGCLGITQAAVTISANNLPTTDLSASAVGGSVVGASDWSPDPPTGFTPPTDPVPVVGTHSLSLQKSSPASFKLSSSMANESADVVVEGGSGFFAKEDLVVISDCERGDLFEVNMTTPGGGDVTLEPTLALANAFKKGVGANDQVQIMRFMADVFYVADTGRNNDSGDDVYSLFQQSYPYVATNPPVELIEGVENMQVRFGIRDSSNTDAVKFVTADSTDFDPQRVSSLQIGLLLSSYEAVAESDDTNIYVLAGVPIVPESAAATNLTHPVDKRIRQAFNATVELRNLRFPESE